MKIVVTVLETLAARRLTIFLMGLAAVVMARFTILEALEKTGETPFRLYLAPGFVTLLWIIWLNLICNAVHRTWWQLKKIPGIMVHLGFLLILTGGFLTFTLGIRGHLTISEDERRSTFERKSPVLHVTGAAVRRDASAPTQANLKTALSFPMNEDGSFESTTLLEALNPLRARSRVTLPTGARAIVLERLDASRSFVEIEADPAGAGPPAITLLLYQNGSEQKIILQAGERVDLKAPEISALTFVAPPESGDTAHLLVREAFAQKIEIQPPEGEALSIPIDLPGDVGREITVGPYEVEILAYHPAFKMGEEPSRDDEPLNPALHLNVSGPCGEQRLFTFAYVEFHGNRFPDGTTVRFRRPRGEHPLLLLAAGADGVDVYQNADSPPRHLATHGELEISSSAEAPRCALALESYLPASHFRERVTADPRGAGPPAYLVQVGEGAQPVWLSAGRGVAQSAQGDLQAFIDFRYDLGFDVILDDAVAEFWPSSGIPRAYYSLVRIATPPGSAPIPARIETNAPLLQQGFRLYQSSMEQQPPYRYSVFSVSRDPGLPLVTAGFLIMSAGLLWLYWRRFVLKPMRARGRRAGPSEGSSIDTGEPAGPARSVAPLLVSVLTAAILTIASAAGHAAQSQDDKPAQPHRAPLESMAQEMKDLVVQSKGRQKPLATHARETLVQLFGRSSLDGRRPLETYASILFQPEAWNERSCLTVDAELAREVYNGKRLISLRQFMENQDAMVSLVRSFQAMASSHAEGGMAAPSGRLKELKRLRDQIMDLFGRANMMGSLESTCRVLPYPNDPGGEWWDPTAVLAAVAGDSGAGLLVGAAAFEEMKASYLRGDEAAFRRSVAVLKDFQRQAGGETPGAAPILSPFMVRLELLYYCVDFRLVGLILFGLASLLHMAQAFSKPSRRRSNILRAALVLSMLGILWNCWIVGGHTAIAGRLPLKNLQEVYLVVLFFVPLIGKVLECFLKAPLYSAFAAVLTTIGFAGSIFLPPDGFMITPLVAILHSPWRQVHILTIMLSYAILLVALGLHLGFLFAVVNRGGARRDENRKRVYSPLADELHNKAYIMVAWGFLFLTIGIATGAAWGHSSWGRYWGWDPKEVWATIAWAIYALFLHLRLFYRIPREVLAVINIIGYAAILFTYFGVSYLLPGLHAYS